MCVFVCVFECSVACACDSSFVCLRACVWLIVCVFTWRVACVCVCVCVFARLIDCLSV